MLTEDQETPPSVNLRGSADGLAALREGRADLGLIAHGPGMEIPPGHVEIPWAFYVAVVVAHRTNPIAELDYDQLSMAYGQRPGRERGAPTWGEVGLGGAWSTRAITPIALRREEDLAMEIFRAKVLGERTWRDGLRTLADPADVEQTVARDPSAIAILSGHRLRGEVRSIPVRVGTSDFAHAPTEDSVYYGDYPLRVPVSLVFPRESQERLAPMLRHLLHDDTADRLRDLGLLTAPANERRESSLMLTVGDRP